MLVRAIAVLACAAVSLRADDVSPIQKVITMLEDMQTQVVTEGRAEAKTYDKFACFCKEMTEEKQESITDGQDETADMTAEINQLLANREALDAVIAEQSAYIDTKNKAMEEEKARRAKDHAEHQRNMDDCYTAVKEIDWAVVELKAKEKVVTGASSLISLKGVAKTVRHMALMADAMGLNPKHGRGVQALLQEPVDDGMEFDAGEVIKEVKNLKPGFEERVDELRAAELKMRYQHTLVMQKLIDEKKVAEQTMRNAEEKKGEAMKKIATNQADLTLTQGMLTDDQSYLKELTDICNAKSQAWDQRSKMRQDELTALTTAINIIKSQVADKDGKAALVVRSTLTDRPSNGTALLATSAAADPVAPEAEGAEEDYDDDVEYIAAGEAPLSPRDAISALQRSVSRRALRASPKGRGDSAVRDVVVELLRRKGQELKSATLTALASEASSDPFAKIKKLIQELVERLLQEAADEANHKGWCDKEMSKAKQSRQLKSQKIKELNTALQENEAKRDQLIESVASLTTMVAELESSLAKTQKDRSDESAENAATVSEAEEGKAAVEQAIDLLDKFYKTSAKATVLVQQGAKAKGVADDMPDAGFDGAYKGLGGASGGVIGMMEVIKSDFEHTIKVTTAEEKEAAAQFLAFETETKSSIAAKNIEKQSKDGEKIETDSEIAEDKQSLVEEQSLFDKTLRELIELQPACVETGMSYAEKVAKREQEIESLKQAMEILDNWKTGFMQRN
jgi:hypothetical protein